MFSLHLDLSPAHQTPTAPNSFVYLTFTNGTSFLTYPSQPFIISLLPPNPSPFRSCASPTSSSHSRMGPHFGRSQEEIAFLWGRQELLQLPTSWTSGHESTLAFHGSTFDPRGEVIKLFILKRNGFPSAKVGGSSSASAVNTGVPIFTSLPQPFKNSRARPTLYVIQAILSGFFATHPFC